MSVIPSWDGRPRHSFDVTIVRVMDSDGRVGIGSAGGRAGWADDIRVLERIRATLGERMRLMVDCNQGWRMPWDTNPSWQLKDALMVARELEGLSVYWMEEPLHRADRKGMAQLRALSPMRIAGGEMTRELHEYRDLIEDRA